MLRKYLLFIGVLVWVSVAGAQPDLYNRYASRTDIRVASVTGFVLDSAGTTADVTLLEAVDDAGWDWLCKEFGLIALNDDQRRQLAQGWEVSMFAQRDRKDPSKPAPVVDERIDVANSCYVGVSYLSRTLYIFCCTTEHESDVVIDYLIKKMRSSMKR